ncbi:uncharacterized protein LOC122665760 [Telopea speciosissima]|uniref:uncharacterized protein LOC122665760 n=1 Tax=Telopea speciosissima TaxID=54955 RepID=UPI001CC5101E|nr:uncharacterized protein LOC122665760 [Telopea speciosissima]
MASKCCGGTLEMKLDVQKAYDTLEWKFLFDVMSKFGFSQSWICWIKEMMRSTKMSILINGGQVGYFGVERGLKQDDPLSLLLFILDEEVLCLGLTNLRMKGVRKVKNFLDCYQDYSGQKINLEKSKVFVGEMSVLRKRKVKEVLQIPECVFPTRYLGVDLFKRRVKKDFILPLVDKFKARLAGWKGRLLSMAGRVELVRSVMCSIPVHNFSVYLWPTSIMELMERWIRNFIWCGDASSSKAITVRWSKLCRPKSEGGLGVRRLKELNLALLAKLAWFIKCDSSRFVDFLRGRLLTANGSLKKGVKSSILPSIRRVWEMVGVNERWIIGNGKKINFWFDRWVNGQRVYDVIAPYVTNPRSLKDKVADYIDEGEWSFPVLRSPELQVVCNQIMQIKLPTTEHEDTRVWALTESGLFSVKSAWEGMRSYAPQQGWARLVWQKGLVPRASVFGWRLTHRSLPTDENVTKRAAHGASCYDLCCRCLELSQHIFIECEFAASVWAATLSMFELSWTGFPSIEELLMVEEEKVSQGWPVRQLDVHNAFLHGLLHEEAACAWFHRLSKFRLNLGFHGSQMDTSLLIRQMGAHVCYILIYVDDILVTGSDSSVMTSLLQQLSSEISIKDLGDLYFILGIEVVTQPKGLLLSQSCYISDLLHHIGMTNYKPAFTDADWTGDGIDRKSTSGFAVFLSPNLISWISRTQRTVARSSIKAEYKILADASAELI